MIEWNQKLKANLKTKEKELKTKEQQLVIKQDRLQQDIVDVEKKMMEDRVVNQDRLVFLFVHIIEQLCTNNW